MLALSANKLVLFMGLGVQELLIIFLAIIFLFGARKIPEIARGLGKGLTEFKKGAHETDDSEVKKQEKSQETTGADKEAKPPSE